MVSLDGLGKYHDAQRAHANGDGSFIEVEKAINLAIKYNCTYTASLGVQEQ